MQALRPGRRRAERIEQRDLDQVVALAGASNRAARLVDADLDLGAVVDAAGELGVVLPHQLDDLGIQLDRDDLRYAVQDRQQHLLAGARAKDQRLRRRQQMVGHRGGGEVEVAERSGVAVEAGDRAEGVSICEDPALLRRLHQIDE